MSTKLTFAMLALLSWLMTFVVLLTTAMHADCSFTHQDFQQKILLTGLVNLVCVVFFISSSFRSPK